MFSIQEEPYTNVDIPESKLEMNNIEKDIKNIVKSVVCTPNIEIDNNIFESKIFREADQLLTGNSRFSELILSVAHELTFTPSEPKIRRIEEESEKVKEPEQAKEPEPEQVNEDEPVDLSTHSENYEIEEKIKTFKLVQFSEFALTDDEVTWTDKMYQNIANTFKILIRPDFYKGVMDLQLGNINMLQFKQVPFV